MEYKVKVNNVSKLYSTQSRRSERLLNIFRMNKQSTNKLFAAVRDVSFVARSGETIGILGLNGSGKSTLSNLIAQVIQPTIGSIELNGTPSLIAISAGLNNNLSGLDNIKLKCLMHGLTIEEIKKVEQDIIEFADLGDYINQPVKNYSSGMRSRLGFSISVHTDPDILIIDEALSVGDSTFANKSLEKINDFKAKGKTIFFVSHSAGQMRTFCDRVVWLHFGKVKEIGESNEVVNKYMNYTKEVNKLSAEEKKENRKNQLKEQYLDVNSVPGLVEHKFSLKNLLASVLFVTPLIITGVLIGMGY